ncbi:hypothetical protein ACFSBG_01975 [Georgenia yuyongxinii]|uniref:hypothetical protein n=1 Tax=Georgenia yuyongxinii TaxID=2589797 RepID=UPI001E48F578|nr:hypothetical protein [Georgenia yuyongxinii]
MSWRTAARRGGDVDRPGHRIATGTSDEKGRILLLTLAFGALVLTLVLVVASASAVHIERKRLLALADTVAADAADAVDEAAYYQGLLGGEAAGATRVPLTTATVRAAVRDHLLAPASGAANFEALRVAEPTGTPDGVTAEVTLVALARPPLVPWPIVPWSEGITLRVTSTARAG